MLPAVGLALEALGAEALTPGIMQLAELATEMDGGELTVPLRSSWLESFSYTLATGEMTVNMQDGGSYTYPGISISTAIGFANAASPGSFCDRNIKLSGKCAKSSKVHSRFHPRCTVVFIEGAHPFS